MCDLDCKSYLFLYFSIFVNLFSGFVAVLVFVFLCVNVLFLYYITNCLYHSCKEEWLKPIT